MFLKPNIRRLIEKKEYNKLFRAFSSGNRGIAEAAKSGFLSLYVEKEAVEYFLNNIQEFYQQFEKDELEKFLINAHESACENTRIEIINAVAEKAAKGPSVQSRWSTDILYSFYNGSSGYLQSYLKSFNGLMLKEHLDKLETIHSDDCGYSDYYGDGGYCSHSDSRQTEHYDDGEIRYFIGGRR